MPRLIRWALVAAVAVLVSTPVSAQVEELGVGAGVSVPVYEVAESRGPGPHALAYVGFRLGPTLQLRGQGAFSQLSGETRDGRQFGDLRVVSVSAALVWSPAGTGDGAYGIGGLGLYSLRDSDGGANPESLVPGLTLGVGTNLRLRRGLGLFGQLGVEVPFTSFATGTESAPPMYLPFVVGVRVPCCGARAPSGG